MTDDTNATEKMSPSMDERISGAVSHLVFYLYILILAVLGPLIGNSLIGIILWLITPPLISLMIYFAFKKRSSFTAFHSLQAAIFHFIVGGVFALVGVISAPSSSNPETATSVGGMIGICLFPFIWLPFVPLFAAIRAMRGRNFYYPLIGKLIEQ